MSVIYCSSCDRYVDTDYEMGCELCLGNNLRWCWACSRGYAPDEHHPDEAQHKKEGFIDSYLEEDEKDPGYHCVQEKDWEKGW